MDKKKLNEYHESFYESYYSSLIEKLGYTPLLLNIGPGSFKHPHWKTVDRLYEGGLTWGQIRKKPWENTPDFIYDLLSNEPMPFEDNSVDVVYCSHLIEHAFNENILFFFKEVKRILRGGGVFRVIAPDADLGVRSFINNDPAYFTKYKAADGMRGMDDLPCLTTDVKKIRNYIAFELLRHNSQIMNPDNEGFVLEKKDALHFIESYPSVYDALDHASELSSNCSLGGHVNWFNFEKIKAYLIVAGFNNIVRSGFGQSVFPGCRDTRYFDKTDMRMSVYVDATK